MSGAWEGSGDTLLHVQGAGTVTPSFSSRKPGTIDERHGTTLKLAWTDGEGYELEGDRDLLAEVDEFLAEQGWRTVKEIGASPESDPPGIGANQAAIRKVVDRNPDRFDSRTGDDAKALGRHPSAVLWRSISGSDSPDSPERIPGLLGGGRDGGESVNPPVGDSPPTDSPPAGSSEHGPIVNRAADSPRRTAGTVLLRGWRRRADRRRSLLRCFGTLGEV